MTERTQEWAERVGREAVGLGMKPARGMMWGPEAVHMIAAFGWGRSWPDFRDRLTELACIDWVHSVADDAYGGDAWVRVDGYLDVAFVNVCPGTAQPFAARGEGDTLAEACIAAVRAMKGGE